jgi:hypothetical protein
MKTTLNLLISFSILLLFSNCSKSQETSHAVNMELPNKNKENSSESDYKIDVNEARKVIKDGFIKLETSNLYESKTLIEKTVKELNGYIAKDETDGQNNNIEQQYEIRIPANHFDDLVKIISESSMKLESKNINVSDVTEEYIDIESRIKTKKELEEQYKALLKKATKVDEILNIEREMGSLRSEIESVEGRLKFMKDRISLSTLKVNFYQKTGSTSSFSNQLGYSFRKGWDNFIGFMLGLTQFWVFILVGFAAFFVFKRFRKAK